MFRKMRRFKQQLSIEQDQHVLSTAYRGTLSVLGDDGYPYGLPINYVYDPSVGELGAIYFHSAKAGHKVDAMAACDKVSFYALGEGVQNPGEWWWYFDSVICFGRASVIEDPQRKHDAMVMFGKKYFPTNEELVEEIENSGARANMYEIRIEHMTGKHVEEK